MPVTKTSGNMRQEGHEFIDNLGHLIRTCLKNRQTRKNKIQKHRQVKS